MPYVITTRAYATSSLLPREPAPRTRRAVATIEEAREAVLARINAVTEQLFADGPSRDEWKAVNDLPEVGGTIGPLPDGTVIEVKLVLIDNLIVSGGLKTQYVTAARYRDTAMSDADVIAAYNAAQVRS